MSSEFLFQRLKNAPAPARPVELRRRRHRIVPWHTIHNLLYPRLPRSPPLLQRLGDRAIEQCPDNHLFTTSTQNPTPSPSSSSTCRKHALSLDDFLTTDGRKARSHRDAEFETPRKLVLVLIALWEAGWKICLDALDALKDEDLTRTITIRTEPHSVMQAINRQVGALRSPRRANRVLAKHFCRLKLANR